MQFPQNLFITVFLLGAVQGIFLSLLLIRRQSNKKANKILAFLMFFYSAFILKSVLLATDVYLKFPHLLGFFPGVPFLFGPLHYLYARYLISLQSKFSKLQWLHFFPFVIGTAIYFPYFFLSREKLVLFIQNTAANSESVLNLVFNWAIVLQGLTYMILTLFLLKNFSIRSKDYFSTLDKINLNWLRNITFLTSCVWIIVLIVHLPFVTGLHLFGDSDNPIAFATSILIYTMGYLGLRQPEIFSEYKYHLQQHFTSKAAHTKKTIESKYSVLPEYNFEKQKYERSGLTQEKAKRYLQNLLDLMNEEKPFINSSLSLHELSEKLSISAHNLSEIINTHLKQNFFDFVNHHRVEEVKKGLIDPEKQHYTLLAIAIDAGFNSKSSFNTIFKKHTNMTPSQYKRSVDLSEA